MALRGCRTARSQIGEGAREAWPVVTWGTIHCQTTKGQATGVQSEMACIASPPLSSAGFTTFEPSQSPTGRATSQLSALHLPPPLSISASARRRHHPLLTVLQTRGATISVAAQLGQR